MKQIISIITVAILVTIGSCTTPMTTFKSNANGWKPNDFDPNNGVLLIEKITRPKLEQKKIEEYMLKNYPYRYEFVDAADLKGSNKKFEDKNVYQFALVSTYKIINIHEGKIDKTGFKKPLNVGIFDFNFIDRLNNKVYPKSGIYSSWASMTFKKIIETCLEKK
ncbi:MAG: hypothetical protein QM541_00810 [Flavobacterium sp.]|nr:hypothetical protein [Flavobacterium sp.]